MVKKGNRWNLAELQETLVKDAEEKISQGFEEIAEGAKGSGTDATSEGEKDTSGTGTSVPSETAHMEPVPTVSAAATVKRAMETEPTKGIQTNVPMSVYRRLNDIKLSRGETIGNLVAEAVLFWLDVQEGKCKVSATT